jgi:hypothetical protein
MMMMKMAPAAAIKLNENHSSEFQENELQVYIFR